MVAFAHLQSLYNENTFSSFLRPVRNTVLLNFNCRLYFYGIYSNLSRGKAGFVIIEKTKHYFTPYSL